MTEDQYKADYEILQYNLRAALVTFERNLQRYIDDVVELKKQYLKYNNELPATLMKEE